MSVTSSNAAPLLPYRADIDGLRAFAVLAVVLFHAFPKILGGGFIGVDVFFVISGFLISTIIFTGLARGDFNLFIFYGRRIRRIFPALIIVLAVSYVAGWFVLLGDEYKQLGKHIAGAAAFVSNFILWSESGYFDNASNTKPLLHLWSLGIEEQFYLLWPPLAYAAWRCRVNFWLPIAIILVGSFLFCVIGRHAYPVDRFYLPHSRFWELMAGAALAHFMLCRPPVMGVMTRNLLSFTGMGLFVGAAIGLTKLHTFPGFWALIPTLGACLLIAAGPEAWINRYVLADRRMVWIGLISFPLYLWHWPILTFMNIIVTGTPSVILRVIAVLVSIILSCMTYQWVEKPIRFGGHSKEKAVWLLVLMVILGSTGAYCYARDGFISRLPQELQADVSIQFDWAYPTDAMQLKVMDGHKVYTVGGEGKQTFFFGDSNMEQYAPRISALLEERASDARGAIFLNGAAPPFEGVIRDGTPGAYSTDLALKIARDPKVDRVVIAAAWAGYFVQNKSDFGVFTTDQYHLGKYTLEQPEGKKLAFERLAKFIHTLRALDKKVYLVASIPAGKEFGAKINPDKRQVILTHSFNLAPPPSVPKQVVMERLSFMYDELARIAKQEGAILVDPVEALCADDVCRTDAHRDQGHLRASFVKERATYLDMTVQDF